MEMSKDETLWLQSEGEKNAHGFRSKRARLCNRFRMW